MSRSGYVEWDECDEGNWSMIRERGAFLSSVRGKRGQAFLRELIERLEAMPVRELAGDFLENEEGAQCALGVVAEGRGLDISRYRVDPDEFQEDQLYDDLADDLGIAPTLVRQVMWQNDEGVWATDSRAVRRWHWVHDWATRLLTISPTPE